ncbi:MAG TPA: RDD family protein [Dehalococcoidia bacterium]|nr:RDD family protein [Dehalococcoidia bacterium]
MREAASTSDYASFGKRLGGAILDAIIVWIPTYLITLAAIRSGSILTAYALGFAIGALYYTWGFGSGQTIACMLFGMRIVDEQTAEAPGYGKGLLRYVVSAILGYVIIGIVGDLWMLWDEKRQTWQDKAAGTLAVNA